MVRYEAKLSDYLGSRKVIGATFFTSVDTAQHACEDACKSAETFNAQNAAQAHFKAQIKTASEVFSAAIKGLGPRPVRTIEGKSKGNSHETHNLAPYGD